MIVLLQNKGVGEGGDEEDEDELQAAGSNEVETVKRDIPAQVGNIWNDQRWNAEIKQNMSFLNKTTASFLRYIR